MSDRLAEAVEVFQEESWRDEFAVEMARAVAAYRSTGGRDA